MRTRHQAGSVQQRVRRGKLTWVGLYRDPGGNRRITELDGCKTKTQAKAKMAEFLMPVNAERTAKSTGRNITLAAYTEHVFIPFKKRRWKASTAATNCERLSHHIIEGELGQVPVVKLDRDQMQAFLDARRDCSKSVLDHLRFDLSDILKLAESDGLVDRNPAKAIFTPRKPVSSAPKQVMTHEQVKQALETLDIRERAFVRLAVIAGMRPGEIVALKWDDVQGEKATVSKRVYRGVIDTTKNAESRDVYLSPSTRRDLELWRQFALENSEYVFGSENGTPIWYQNIWARSIEPKLKKIGMGWANFQVMRRTNATLMEKAGADPKAAADQRGHDIGVSIDVYTQATMAQKADAVNKLEALLIQ
jgi:integrase